jgi:hypothetical protein
VAGTRALGWRGPGLGWLPAVLRSRATWRTVGRFVLWGPAVGAAPYAWLLFTLPFAYAIGALPALLAGLLFALWLHGGGRRWPTLRWRVAVGALCGLAPALVAMLPTLVLASQPEPFWPAVLAMHGVPAAMVLAAMQRGQKTA